METKEYMQEEVTTQEEVKELTLSDLCTIFNRINGRNIDGDSKVAISYQSYAMDEPEDSPNRSQVYSTTKPSILMSFEKNYPDFYTLDICFHSFEDPELKLLWGRLQRFRNNIAMHPEKDWIFYFNILEASSLGDQNQNEDLLFMVHILNPELCFLTREVPNMQTTESYSQLDNTLYGGNIIRMLIPSGLVRFEVKEVDTSEIKGNVLREIEAQRYQDSEDTDEGENW